MVDVKPPNRTRAKRPEEKSAGIVAGECVHVAKISIIESLNVRATIHSRTLSFRTAASAFLERLSPGRRTAGGRKWRTIVS